MIIIYSTYWYAFVHCPIHVHAKSTKVLKCIFCLSSTETLGVPVLLPDVQTKTRFSVPRSPRSQSGRCSCLQRMWRQWVRIEEQVLCAHQDVSNTYATHKRIELSDGTL